jgi:hypothetical protein
VVNFIARIGPRTSGRAYRRRKGAIEVVLLLLMFRLARHAMYSALQFSSEWARKLYSQSKVHRCAGSGDVCSKGASDKELEAAGKDLSTSFLVMMRITSADGTF